MPVREWDGASYDRISGPQKAMGLEVLDRLELSGEEVVLDAGCGSGRITETLIERLPGGRVIAVDGSESMIDAARRRLGADVDLRVMDLLDLELGQQVDAILSTATFHWIADHDRLFTRLRAALRDGGRLIAQCGGEGNIDVLRGRAAKVMARDPYAEHFRDWLAPWHYATPADTRERLLGAGFTSAECWLTPAPAQPEQPREFLTTIILEPNVKQLPAGLREPFMDEVMSELGEPVIVDYIRLNIEAIA
jgi:trans-aconitate 2-methyltransferase